MSRMCVNNGNSRQVRVDGALMHTYVNALSALRV